MDTSPELAKKGCKKTSMILWKLIFLMQNTMQKYEENQKNQEKPSKVIIMFIEESR